MNRTRMLSGWYRDARVRSKILLGNFLVLLFLIIVAAVVLVQTGALAELNEQTREAERVQNAANDAGLAVADRTSTFRDFLISGQDEALTMYQQAQTRVTANLAEARRVVTDADQLAQIDSVTRLAEEWRVNVAEVGIALRRSTLEPGGPGMEVVVAFMQTGVGRRSAQATRLALQEFKDRQEQIADARRAEVSSAIGAIRLVTLLATLVAFVLGILVAASVANRISRLLREAVGFASAVAQGDLSRSLVVEGDDEIGELTGTLNRMAADLRTTIAGVGAAAGQVATSAEQIAATTEEISYTVDEQVRSSEETSSSMEQIASQISRVSASTESLAASVDQTASSINQMGTTIEETARRTDALGASVEQTSATIEEMVASISEVGRHIEETRGLASRAEADARGGSEIVGRASDGMRRIREEVDQLTATMRELAASSTSVSRVSEVIEDIADQTNLLALNAAIEAARAGDEGRGFAVVAQEIRRLAERAVESTREISATIRDVLTEVGQTEVSTARVAERTREGLQLAADASQALGQITESSGRTRELMDEVSLATQHQTSAAQQAQQAIRHIQQLSAEMLISTREQAYGGRQIVQAVENMNRQTQDVFAATTEQKRGGELILQATEAISGGLRATQDAVQDMASAAEDLSAQAAKMNDLVRAFRV